MEEVRTRNESEEDTDFLFYFRNGMSWQQLLLYIYKNNKIIFKKSDFRDHYNENKTANFFSPNAINDSSHFGYEDDVESQLQRDSFMTLEVSRKDSEMHLVDNNDKSS